MNGVPPSCTPQRDSFFYSLVFGIIVVNLFACLTVGNSLYNSRKHYDRLAEVTTPNLAKSLEGNFSDIMDKMFSHGICPDCAGEQRRIFQKAAASQKDVTNSP